MQTSTIKRTKQDKLAALVGNLALKIAKKNNDPMYEKYAKYRKQYLELKQELIRKYMSKAKQAAKQAMRK